MDLVGALDCVLAWFVEELRRTGSDWISVDSAHSLATDAGIVDPKRGPLDEVAARAVRLGEWRGYIERRHNDRWPELNGVEFRMFEEGQVIGEAHVRTQGQKSKAAPQRGRISAPVTGEAVAIGIFISHSSVDQKLAKLLLETLEVTLVLPQNYVRCTSVPGYRLPGGADTASQLRGELDGSQVIIALVTPALATSVYSHFELGAGWALSKLTIPVVGPGAEFKDIPGPLGQRHGLRTYAEEDIHQLVDDLVDALQLTKKSTSGAIGKIKELVGYKPGP